MSDTCPSCGGPINATTEIDTFCYHCGACLRPERKTVCNPVRLVLAENARLREQIAGYERDTEQFNDGCDAAEAGKPYEEPHYYEDDRDTWRIGYAWGKWIAALDAANGE